MATKRVYVHDENGAYLYPYDAQASPMEPGKFIEPTHSTAYPPPKFDPEKEVAVFASGKWSVNKLPATGIVAGIVKAVKSLVA